MPQLDAWKQAQTGAINPAQRAVDVWTRINRNAASVTLVRDGISQPAQTMRVVFDSNVSSRGGRNDIGASNTRDAVLFGVRGHPDSAIADTDIQRNDQFVYGGLLLKVTDVIQVPGGVQASAEAVS